MRYIKKCFAILLLTAMLLSFSLPASAAGGTVIDTEEKKDAQTAAYDIVSAYNNPNGRVLSVARYGNPRLFPANSLEGIKSCIELKIDIVSVNVQKTKDNQLVLLSGANLKNWCVNKDDNTPATGTVSDYTLEELKNKFYLKEGYGGSDAKPTKYEIASFEEVISVCKDYIMVIVNNGFKYSAEVNSLARSMEACDIIILRGAATAEEVSTFVSDSGTPICHIASSYTGNTSGSAKSFVTDTINAGATMVELSAKKSMSSIFNKSVLSKFENKGRAFISTSKPELCGGRLDLIADWTDLIDRGYSVIETDYPKELANYIGEIESYRKELSALITEAQSLNTSKYTKDSTTELASTLKEAESISAIGCISLGKIDEARYNIQESLDNLTLRSENDKTSLPVWAIILIIIGSIILLLVLVIVGLRIYNRIRSKKRKMDKFKDNFKNRAPEANDTLTSISGEEVSLSNIEAELDAPEETTTAAEDELDKLEEAAQAMVNLESTYEKSEEINADE